MLSPVAPPDDPESLVQRLREELIKTQLIVLDLNDRALATETDKADAVAILGKVELVLEQKINYISELDRALNNRIAELGSELQAVQAAAQRQTDELLRTREERDREFRARDAIIRDLADRLELANQEISKAHGIASGFARDASNTRDALLAEQGQHEQTRTQLATTQEQLARRDADLAAKHLELTARLAALATSTQTLADREQALFDTQRALAHAQRIHDTILRSTFWKWGRPWRALFGPKL